VRTCERNREKHTKKKNARYANAIPTTTRHVGWELNLSLAVTRMGGPELPIEAFLSDVQ